VCKQLSLGVWLTPVGSIRLFASRSVWVSCVCRATLSLVPYENVDFESDGVTLNGWFMESNSSAPTPAVPILYSHGSGKNVAVRYRVERYEFLLSLGVKLFVYDYPGYVDRPPGIWLPPQPLRHVSCMVPCQCTRNSHTYHHRVSCSCSCSGALALALARALSYSRSERAGMAKVKATPVRAPSTLPRVMLIMCWWRRPM